MVAVMEGHTDVAKFLINSNADISQVDDMNRTCLHWAIFYSRLDQVEYFVRDCAMSLLQEDAEKETAIHAAVTENHISLLAWLIREGGGNINTVNSVGASALRFLQGIHSGFRVVASGRRS